MTKPKPKTVNDFSRCLDPLDMDATLIAVIEMSQSSWLVAGIVPGVAGLVPVQPEPVRAIAVGVVAVAVVEPVVGALGPREVGHLHGDHAAHFMFGAGLGAELKVAGRVVDHPVFPGKPGPAARRIEDESDVKAVIDLMRLNYERIISAGGVPERAA